MKNQQEEKNKRVDRIASTLDWSENQKRKLYSIPDKKIEDLNVIWLYCTTELSYQQIANKLKITKSRVRYILREM